MVVINIKKDTGDSFLYETSCENSNDLVIRELVTIWNLRLRLRQLVGGIREMAMYGPMKPPDKAGLDDIEEKYNGAVIEKNQFYQADPSGARTGCGVGPQLTETIEKVCIDTEAILSSDNVQRKIAVSVPKLLEKLDLIRGVVTMAFPMGLPEWDTIRLTLNGNEGIEGTSAGVELLDPETAELWVASRMFDRNQIVADRLGRNDKTKVIGKLQKPGAGPPGREAAVSEEEKKAMSV